MSSMPQSIFGQAEALLEMAVPQRELSDRDARVIHASAIFILQMIESMAMAQRVKFDTEHGSDVFEILSQELFNRPLTAADVKAYPKYFIEGPGRLRAQYTLCDHNYGLLDSCPNCP